MGKTDHWFKLPTSPPTIHIIWGKGVGMPMVPPPAPGLAAFALLVAVVHVFADALQGVVSSGLGEDLSYPSPAMSAGRVAALFLLHPCFEYGVAGKGELVPLWEEVASFKGRTKGLATLNHDFLQGIPSCRRLFGLRAYFSVSLLIL